MKNQASFSSKESKKKKKKKKTCCLLQFLFGADIVLVVY